MHITRAVLGRFIPWNYIPGSQWGGKQRRIPRLTHARKSAFLDHLLLSKRNHEYLSNPCLSEEVESAVLEDERKRELIEEDQVFYRRYAEQFHTRFRSRYLTDTWTRVLQSGKFEA